CCGRPCTPNGCHESHEQGLCCISGPPQNYDTIRFDRQEDCILCAAAPDLLAACNVARERFEHAAANLGGADTDVCKQLDAAIAKAVGHDGWLGQKGN
ncbi:MAG TPA: hypothetical protein VHB77_06840, partial [Planctomycetaceae bacterium]|nr:hypothetical protein [Planctomycetaceae bacterium]